MSKKIIIGVVVIAALAIVVTLVNKNSESTATNNVVTIGLISGVTGEYAVVGENFVKGAEVALDEWNQTHPDRQVELVIEDDGFNATKGLSAYKKLTTLDGVDAVLNMTSVTIDAIYNDVVKSQIPLVQFGEQGIEPTDDNVFQVLEGNIATEVALGEYAKSKGYKNVAVFVSNNATLERFYGGFATGYQAEHKVYRLDIGGSNIKTEVLKALSEKPDAVVIVMAPGDGAIVAREVNIHNTDVPLLLDVNAYTGWSDYQKLFGDTNALNGDTLVSLKQGEVTEKFAAAYQAKHGSEVGVGSAWGYDGLVFLLATMAENPEDKTTWTANMKTTEVVGATTKLVFDDAGVRLPEYFIGTISNGALPTE